MTERRRRAVRTDRGSFSVGPSDVQWDGNALTIRFDEITMPLPGALRGKVRLIPHALTDYVVDLDGSGHHHWWPIAPCARIEVDLRNPAAKWSGEGYMDSNWGTEGLEDAFVQWNWSRAALNNGTAILYNAQRRARDPLTLAVHFSKEGEPEEFESPPPVELARGFWGVRRETRSENGKPCRLVKTLEDSPFYNRSVLQAHLRGQEVEAIHESLDLDRFKHPIVRLMLPFRMPRTLR